MKCTTCKENVGDEGFRLSERGSRIKEFCSFECVIEYSVTQLLRRWRRQIQRLWTVSHGGKERRDCRSGWGTVDVLMGKPFLPKALSKKVREAREDTRQ